MFAERHELLGHQDTNKEPAAPGLSSRTFLLLLAAAAVVLQTLCSPGPAAACEAPRHGEAVPAVGLFVQMPI